MASVAPAPRRPEDRLLYRIVTRHLETFLTHGAETDRRVPAFVEREFRRFLGCGVVAGGLLRLRCSSCAAERLVAFSCKGRVWCPSCGGRRMSEVVPEN